jgi:glycosyltransferase involved in cell wall biosynthesis
MPLIDSTSKEEILPRLDAKRRFIGPVGFHRKKRLLTEARCLLIPSTVQETSSLIAMEAFASGTPVIAFDSSALPEIVEHGRTGYIVSNSREMARAIAAIGKIKSAECVRSALHHFSAQQNGRSLRATLCSPRYQDCRRTGGDPRGASHVLARRRVATLRT